MSRILITGGTGFIGRAFIEKALPLGHEIHLLTRGNTNAVLGVIHHIADIASYEELSAIFEKVQPEYVVHLAASIDKSRNIERYPELVRVNILGTQYVLRASEEARVKALVSVGSLEEYGNAPTPFLEHVAECPETPYGTTKAISSALVSAYGKGLLATCVLRFPVLYGSGMPENTFMGKLRVAALGGTKIPLGKSPVSRDFLHVVDAAQAILMALNDTSKYSGEIINVCSGVEMSLQEVVEMAQRITGKDSLAETGTFAERKQEQLSYVGSNTKALALLGWSPGISLEEGLGRFLT